MRSLDAHLAAREAVIGAIADSGPPATIAERLDAAAERCASTVPEEPGATAERWHGLTELLRIAAALFRWDAAIRDAEPEADRFLRSAQRQAELLREKLRADPDRAADLVDLTEAARAVASPEDVEAFRQRLAPVPLPLSVIAADPGRRTFPSAEDGDEPPPEQPRAVSILLLDDAPVDDVVRVRPNRVHSLGVLVRVLAWPAELPILTIRFTSVWGPTTLEATPLRLQRPEGPASEPLAVEGDVDLVLRASGDNPFSLALEATLAAGADAEEQEITVLGHRRLAVRAFDPALDVITGAETVDERLHEIFATLKTKVGESELQAFARFFSAVARAAVALQVDNVFRDGRVVQERDFQDEMQRRLRADATLEGRLERTQVAGGITDLVHDGVNCELKVEPTRAVTLEEAQKYLGQPVQYESSTQRQLSLLCILDMSPKDLPPGILANNIALLEPRLQGAAHPAHPSWVGAIVVPGNLPVPSTWAGARVPIVPSGDAESD